MGLGATLISKNVGRVCAPTVGKATIAIVMVNIRNIAIAAAILFLVILLSPFV
jgi:hypothetical protein